jgi:very-short-patch-repair endonuclease
MTKEQVDAHQLKVKRNATPPATLVAAPSKEGAEPVRAAPQYETWLESQLVAAGVTGIEREYLWARGRKYRADLAIPEKHLLIECVGQVHRIADKFLRDIERMQCAVLQGWVIFPVTNKQVRSGEACRLVRQALSALMAKGVPF